MTRDKYRHIKRHIHSSEKAAISSLSFREPSLLWGKEKNVPNRINVSYLAFVEYTQVSTAQVITLTNLCTEDALILECP